MTLEKYSKYVEHPAIYSTASGYRTRVWCELLKTGHTGWQCSAHILHGAAKQYADLRSTANPIVSHRPLLEGMMPHVIGQQAEIS